MIVPASRRPLERAAQQRWAHSSRKGQLPSSSCSISRYSSVRPWLSDTQIGWLRSLHTHTARVCGVWVGRVVRGTLSACGVGGKLSSQCPHQHQHHHQPG
jgi:hypothetical protein